MRHFLSYKVKRWIIILIVGIAIYLIGLNISRLVFYGYNMWKYCADFETYDSEFEVIKNYVKERCLSVDEQYFYVSVTEENGRGLFDPKINEFIDITPEVKVALETICDSGFPNKDSILDTVYVQGENVIFCIENAWYALVYSPGGKPSETVFFNESKNIKVKQINDAWYHVVNESD